MVGHIIFYFVVKMTQLSDLTNERLTTIYDLLYKDQTSFNDFLVENNNNPQNARKDIIDQIKFGLKQTNYDGSLNNPEAIYWYSKGLSNAAKKPQTKKQMNDLDKLFFDNLKNKLATARVSRDDSSIIARQRPIPYKQVFTRQGYDDQLRMVNAMMDKCRRTPHDWEINFDILNDRGKELIFDQLKDFLQSIIARFPMIEHFKLQYNVGGEWRTKPLNPKTWNDLVESFTKQDFLFEYDNELPPEYFYEKGAMELPHWSLFSAIRFCRINTEGGYNTVEGSFFQYLVSREVPRPIRDYLIRLQIFDSLVNWKGHQREELYDCCFVYALQQTGCYDEELLNQIRLRINNRYLTQKCINELCLEFNIHVDLIYIDDNAPAGSKKKTKVRSQTNNHRKNYMGIEKAEPNRTHRINVFQKHYFIEEETPISTYYIKNWQSLTDESVFNKEYRKKTKNGKVYHYWASNCFHISSSNLVRYLFRENYFKPITYGEYSILNTIFYNEIDSNIDHMNLEFNENYCTKLIAPRPYKKPEKTRIEPTFWYADFECDTSGEIHKAFMVVVQNKDGDICREFRGEDCPVQFLQYLPDGSIVYFHNLAYDIRFLAKYGINKSIIKGTKTMMTDIKYDGKTLHFKDSLPILSCNLSQLPQMFDIPNIQKEIFPYKYYTLERLKRNYGQISIAGEEEDKKWTKDDYALFRSNIDKIKGCRIDEDHFDMWKYCSFYCQQDVNILRLGFNQFRDGFVKDFNIDPFRFISISSLANEVFNQRVYYNHDLYQVGGVVRKFCSHAVYGGRCMTAYNKKWHTTVELCDFDAVSLYPSAMSRLYTVKGKPKVIEPENLNLDFLSKQGAYIVEIRISQVGKHYAFPLIVKKTKEGNKNNDKLAEGETVKMVVDNITLEDLIEFQQIKFEILRGYYWPGERDYTIQEEIKKIFEKRKEYKKQKNPLQQLYKLIMNSCYGKTIERPIEKDFKYFKEGDELDRYWKKNYNKIVEDIRIESPKQIIHAVKTLKPIDQHFNFSLLGIQVLSMSKRIMNEVMCLAFDLGCKIYYQDTDSFMIEKNDLSKLEVEFNKKYQRKLIGSDLGQFHCDFPTIKDHTEMPWSIEAYFLMKKMYIHKITDSTKDIDYVIRGKGLTLNSIKELAKENFDGDYMALYKAIFDGAVETFDLTKGQPCFKLQKNMTVSTLNEFKRRIRTNYEEGKVEDYFKY